MLIVERSVWKDGWNTWRAVPCDCGNSYCTDWKLSFAYSDERSAIDNFSFEDARMATAAPKLVQAVMSVACSPIWDTLNDYQQTELRNSLKAALGAEKVIEDA